MADYGTIVLTTMAKEPERTQSVAEIVSVTGLPVPSVSKLLKIFIRQGLVQSLRGAKGGYKLSRPPAEITTAQIINAIDGPVGMTQCSGGPGLCGHQPRCQVHGHWHRVSRLMLEALEQISLQQMSEPVVDTMSLTDLRPKQPSVTNPRTIGDTS